MKKVFCVILSVLMALSLGVITFAADDAPLRSGTCGADIAWRYDADGTLTVSGSGAIAPLERTIMTETEVFDDETGESSTVTEPETEYYFPWDTLAEEITAERRGFESVDELDASLDGASDEEFAAYRIELANVVRAIVIAEGVTRIADGAFSVFTPASVTIASTVTKISQSFDVRFAESVTVMNSKVKIADCLELEAAFDEANACPDRDEALRAWVWRSMTGEGDEDVTVLSVGQAPVYVEGYYEEGSIELVETDRRPVYLHTFYHFYGGSGSTLDTACAATGVAFTAIEVPDVPDIEEEPDNPPPVDDTKPAWQMFFINIWNGIKSFFVRIGDFFRGIFKR